jgi:hypothetical protein
MHDLIAKYLVGVPEDRHQQVLTEMLKSFWFQHRDYLESVADKNHPFRDDALRELGEWKALGATVLAQGFFQPNMHGYGYANRLASLNVPMAEVLIRYANRSSKMPTEGRRTDVLQEKQRGLKRV